MLFCNMKEQNLFPLNCSHEPGLVQLSLVPCSRSSSCHIFTMVLLKNNASFSEVIQMDQIIILSSNMTLEDVHESFEDHVTNLDFWLEGVLLFSVACFGCVGNIALIMIFTIHRNKIRTFHR